MIDLARKHGKPLLYCRIYSYVSGKGVVASGVTLSNPEQANRAWSTWYKELFNTVESNPDVVKAFSYINADWPSEAMWQGDTGDFQQDRCTVTDQSGHHGEVERENENGKIYP
ncbi:MAG: hypothetical protein ACLUE2_10655 [Bacteroides cellulosilyticus]